MYNYLLASRAGIITGRLLARNLGLRFHTNVSKIKPESRVLIRYGNYLTSSKIIEDTTINSIETILNISNKNNLNTLLSGTGIITPIYIPINSFEKDDKHFIDGEEKLYLGRNKYHRAGLDIKKFNITENIPENIEYIVPYIRTSREYRLHYLLGNIVKIFRKLKSDDGCDDSIIRTSSYGWRFSLTNLDQIKHGELLPEVVNIVANKLNIFLGGFDIGWSPPNNAWIIYEINSAPSLNTETLQIYSNILKDNINYGNDKPN